MSESVRGVWAIPPPDFDESNTMLLPVMSVLVKEPKVQLTVNVECDEERT